MWGKEEKRGIAERNALIGCLCGLGERTCFCNVWRSGLYRGVGGFMRAGRRDGALTFSSAIEYALSFRFEGLLKDTYESAAKSVNAPFRSEDWLLLVKGY
jgi:hypothetical protein